MTIAWHVLWWESALFSSRPIDATLRGLKILEIFKVQLFEGFIVATKRSWNNCCLKRMQPTLNCCKFEKHNCLKIHCNCWPITSVAQKNRGNAKKKTLITKMIINKSISGIFFDYWKSLLHWSNNCHWHSPLSRQTNKKNGKSSPNFQLFGCCWRPSQPGSQQLA